MKSIQECINEEWNLMVECMDEAKKIRLLMDDEWKINPLLSENLYLKYKILSDSRREHFYNIEYLYKLKNQFYGCEFVICPPDHYHDPEITIKIANQIYKKENK